MMQPVTVADQPRCSNLIQFKSHAYSHTSQITHAR